MFVIRSSALQKEEPLMQKDFAKHLGSSLPDGDELALGWRELSKLAAEKSWPDLERELAKRLNEEEFKLQRNGPQPNFLWLGWRVLIFAAYAIPAVSWEERIKLLREKSFAILCSRQRILEAATRNLDRLQALLATNNSAAWTELAAIMRRDMDNPDWALEAAEIALRKEKTNAAAKRVKIAALGELGEFDQAHKIFEQFDDDEAHNHYSLATISKIEMREGALRDALLDGLLGFRKNQSSPMARLVGNICSELGEVSSAHQWFERAEFLEGPIRETITTAHKEGLLKMADETLRQFPKAFKTRTAIQS
jgi:tetratricopeptide (TPR) repeat protein